MAEPLKNFYNRDFFDKLGSLLLQEIKGFKPEEFQRKIMNGQWKSMELKERTRHITQVLHGFLPRHFEDAAPIVVRISQVLRAAGEKEQAFWHIYLPDYIEQFGADHFDLSMRSLEEITQLVSAEFAIRPFILRYPEKTMKQMLDWSRHPAASVRRLASEGCRPRLPWAIGLPMFKKDPAPILPILENLKQDPSEYVRRSVANNLNDIAKDHPGLVLKMAARWKGISPETDALIRHGSRTLLKRGNDKALHLHGFNPKSRGEAKSLTIKPRNLKVGDSLSFSFQFTNRENTSTFYRLEYRIWYLTSTGKTSQKVFRIAEKEMRPKESITFTRTQRFTDFTTRKHYPGRHQIEILANGISRLKATFRLVRA